LAQEDLSEADADAWVESVEPPPLAPPPAETEAEALSEPADEAGWDRDIAIAAGGSETPPVEGDESRETVGTDDEPEPDEDRSVRNRLSRLIELLSDEPSDPVETAAPDAGEMPSPPLDEPTAPEPPAEAEAATEQP